MSTRALRPHTGSWATSGCCGHTSTMPDARGSSADTNWILARMAHRERGSRTGRGSDRPLLEGADGQIRLQWCSGAPGVVIAAADYLDEELLLAGAELVWLAGPHGAREGGRHLPRDGRQRLRAAEGLRTNRRRAVARAPAASPCTPSARSSGASPGLTVDG